MSNGTPSHKYVSFCDILGFSNAVSSQFEQTIELYRELQQEMKMFPNVYDVVVSIYSDSILVIHDSLPKVLAVTQMLYTSILRRGWLMRGGIAYGRHWKESDQNNLFIVSEALVKAVEIEKSIKKPIIAISSEIVLDLQFWLPRFEDIFIAPVLHFDGINFVNPFSKYWFNSAEIHLSNLSSKHPTHKAKYEWVLALIASIRRNDLLIPQEVVDQFVELGVLSKIVD